MEFSLGIYKTIKFYLTLLQRCEQKGHTLEIKLLCALFLWLYLSF